MDGGACSTVRIALRTCKAEYVTSDGAALVNDDVQSETEVIGYDLGKLWLSFVVSVIQI